MKKKIFDKLRKNKMCKTVFALSLALALLLSGFQPVRAKANLSLPDYSDIVEGAFAYFVCTTGDDYTGRVLLYVFDGARSGYEHDRILFNFYQNSSSYIRNNVKYQWSDSSGTNYTSKWSPKVYILQTDSVSGHSAWVSGTTVYFPKPNGFLSDTTITEIYTDNYYSLPVSQRARVEQMYIVKSDVDIYYINYFDEVPTYIKAYDSSIPETYGNATEEEWNAFLSDTKDFIGYHYLTENGATLWKEMRFNHDVYPYWEQDEDGTRKLMIYAPYEQTIYMTKDVGRYVEDGIYDYYISTIERTDEHCIQPYAWYTDYQPDTSTPEKVFEVIALPYIKDGWGADANAERTLIEVYDSKADAISAYNADEGIIDSPEVTPTIPPQPSPEPLPPTDDSESMGFVDFIKQFENLFNASGNLWKIMFYCFAFLPQQILWCLWSAVQIFLAVMVIKWIRE